MRPSHGRRGALFAAADHVMGFIRTALRERRCVWDEVSQQLSQKSQRLPWSHHPPVAGDAAARRRGGAAGAHGAARRLLQLARRRFPAERAASHASPLPSAARPRQWRAVYGFGGLWATSDGMPSRVLSPPRHARKGWAVGDTTYGLPLSRAKVTSAHDNAYFIKSKRPTRRLGLCPKIPSWWRSGRRA